LELVTTSARRGKPPRRAGRPSPAEAAQLDNDLREAALRLFLDRGYDATSMDAIAKAAGTTKVTVYARFQSKEELFSSVLWWALQRGDWPQAEAPPRTWTT
jgi:AcrR family transcriptional regulator